MQKEALALVLAAVGALSLSACAGAGTQAAQEAYEACESRGLNRDLLHQDGNEVRIEVLGESAKEISGADDAVDNLQRNQEFGDDDAAGLVTALAALNYSECLVEHTGYPGQSSQLRDGEEWEGWNYSEEPGAGSEVVFIFTATG